MTDHRTSDQRCGKCGGTGDIEPAWPVGPSGAHIPSYRCGHCGGTGIEPNSRPVMNPPAQAEARNRAHAAPQQADPDALCRDKTGASSGSEARPVTATERLTSNPTDIAELRTIADTIEQNGGWRIAAIKIRAAAEELERLRATHETPLDIPDFLRNQKNLASERRAVETFAGRGPDDSEFGTAEWRRDNETPDGVSVAEFVRYRSCLYRANGRLIQLGQEPEKLDYPERPAENG